LRIKPSPSAEKSPRHTNHACHQEEKYHGHAAVRAPRRRRSRRRRRRRRRRREV